MSTGETLSQELNFLRSQGLTSVVTLTCSDADDSLLPQIVNCFEAMVADGNFEYPTPPAEASPLELDEDEPNREEQLLFANLPFHVIKMGNVTHNSRPGLTVEKTANFLSLSYKKLKDRFRRSIAQHPTDPKAIPGLIFICKPSSIGIFSMLIPCY